MEGIKREIADYWTGRVEKFEALRSSYRVRREFPAYTVRSGSPLPFELRETLRKLGFRLG